MDDILPPADQSALTSSHRTARTGRIETVTRSEPGPPQHVAVQSGPAMTHPPCTLAAPPRLDGLIELVMPSAAVGRMDTNVDGRALRRILGALEERYL